MNKVFTNFLVAMTVLGVAVIAGSCNTDKDQDLFAVASIKHSGIDWSENASIPSDYANADGETIGWCEVGTPIQGVTGIWYRNNSQGELMYNLGNVELGSVNSFDANLADSDICDSPLAVNDVWVVKCLDGYVKFKVTSVPADVNNSVDWEVGVEYEFSIITDFPK